MRTILSILLVCIALSFSAQIISTTPAFPSQNEPLTLIYNASEGNGELAGVGQIYMHTGVITNLSPTPTSWQHVVGNWGTADANVAMTALGNDLHQFEFTTSLADFYDLGAGETITALAFVFRNQSGDMVGREADGGDIFYEISDGSFSANFATPAASSIILNIGDVQDFIVQSSEAANLSLTINNTEVASEFDATELSFTYTANTAGTFEFEYLADNGTTGLVGTCTVLVQGAVPVADPPIALQDGINYIDDTTVYLQLHAPNKEHIYAIGDFNDWAFSNDYLMRKALDEERFWVKLEDLTPGQEYRFQYFIEAQNLRIADIYAEKILDPWNDGFISAETYPNLIAYPADETSDAVSVLQTAQPEYNWTDGAYEKPAKENLVIYELLVRDFSAAQNLQTVQDSLDYLEKLGVNAIELMPVNEFEGNLSWGYNCSFFFAADKYYGGGPALKDFVNACHERGMAVIMDIALNHSFGQNPQVRMYFDPSVGDFGQTTAESPWFNQIPKHDFNVGYDYNHESDDTRAFCKRVFGHWLENYHIDGYRMDLSKGFTQNNTLGNIGAWSAFDQSRVDIWGDYAGHIWDIDSDAYIILEHFANNNEETTLANGGLMLWGNSNAQFNEATMGYNSNLISTSYQDRGWNNPHLVSYMESHDEERLMYKNLEFGNNSGAYDITNLETGLSRVELASCFFLPVPGPKMIWQFGELGYDFSINYCENGTINEDCRTASKPVRWDYLEVEERIHLYKVTAALNALKSEYPAFQTNDFNMDVAGFGKRIHLNHSDMNVTIIGNFGVTPLELVPGFQHTGAWYEHFTGEEIEEQNLQNAFLLQPGEYRLYTDVEIPAADLNTAVDEILAFANQRAMAYPNPTSGELNIVWAEGTQVELLRILDLSGKIVLEQTVQTGNKTALDLQQLGVSAGAYILHLEGKNFTDTQRILLK